MNKKVLFGVPIATLGLAAMACGPGGQISVPQGVQPAGTITVNAQYDPTTGQYTAQGSAPLTFNGQPVTAQAPAQVSGITVPAAKAVANNSVSVPPAAPVAPAVAPAQVGPTPTLVPFTTGKSMGVDDFIGILDPNPYQMIKSLDDQAAKKDNPKGGWKLKTGPNELGVFWTGIYEDGFDTTFGGKVSEYRVDGKTGVYLLKPNNEITVPSPGGSLIVVGTNDNAKMNRILGTTTTVIDKNAVIGQTNTKAESCVPAENIVKAFTDHASNQGKIYQSLDELVNANVAARLRSNSASIVSANAYRTIIWVQNGQLKENWTILNTHDGKVIGMATKDGDLYVGYPFSGVQSCGDLDSRTIATK